ncbi:recombinase family protein [Pantoea dispersa]|uniref:recombinase family protein n=1 Tax=Pantoea dispersa TaxID=59814 RepID=UPI000F66C4E0|nr:recombinase family protein [Pantoea dispersa]RRW62459.1 recombinase family protein [Pantoea dispersa]
MAHIGYIRVSTAQQHSERQLAGVQLDRTFEDKLSGKDTNRPGFQAMMQYVREGDTLHVHELSRLGRNTADVLNTVEVLNQRGVAIQFHKEGFTADKSNAMGKLILTVLAAVATAEREMMLERQAEGYRAAKEAGRIPSRGNSTTIDRAGIKAALAAGQSVRGVAAAFGVSTNTVQRIKAEPPA